MRFVVAGYYGAGNMGDELILAGLLREIRRIDPVAEITVLTQDPDDTQCRHGVTGLYLGPLSARGPRAFGWLRSSWVQIFRAVRRADIVVLGGGGLLQDVHDFGAIPYHLQTVCLGLLLGRPVVGVGLGVGPILTGTSRTLIRTVCDHMDEVSVRDARSARELAECGVDPARVTVGADLAFTLARTRPPCRTPSQPPRMAFTIGQSEWLRVANADLARSLSEAAVALRAAEVVLFPMADNARDAQAVLSIANSLTVPYSTMTPPRRPEQFLEFMGGFDVVVSAKLHGVIAAACAGVPAVAVSYAPKVSAVASQLGVPVHGIDSVDAASLTHDTVSRAGDGFSSSRTIQLSRVSSERVRRTIVHALESRARLPWHRRVRVSSSFAMLATLSLARQLPRNALGNYAWASRRPLPDLVNGD